MFRLFTIPLAILLAASASAVAPAQQPGTTDPATQSQASGNQKAEMPMYFIGVDDQGRHITLPRGKVLLVRLQANPSTGYSWSVIGNPAPLVYVSSEYESPDNTQAKAGAPSMQVLRFRTYLAGAVDLKLGYSRPWEKGVAPMKTFEVYITVPEGHLP
jgi:inhibitor of cysteine peptidase